MHASPRLPGFLCLGLLACLSTLSTGCSALNALGVKEPTASFRSASVRDVTPDGVAVDFGVDVANPNGVAVPLSGAQYKLALGGVQVLDDKATQDKSIPAKGSALVTLPVRIDFKQMLAAEQAIVRSGGNIPYAFDGGLEFSPAKQFLSKPIRVPVRFSGTLPLRNALQKALTDPAFLANPDARRLLGSLFGASLPNIPGLPGGLLGR